MFDGRTPVCVSLIGSKLGLLSCLSEGLNHVFRGVIICLIIPCRWGEGGAREREIFFQRDGRPVGILGTVHG